MLLLLQLKFFLKILLSSFCSLPSFIRGLPRLFSSLPRIHILLIASLCAFVLIVSLIPTEIIIDKPIKRELILPASDSLKGKYAIAQPLTAIRESSAKLFPDFSGNREVEITIAAGDTLSGIFSKEGLSAAVLQELQEADTEYLRLGNLFPGQKVQLLINPKNQLLSLKIIVDRAHTLSFTLKDGAYVPHLEVKEGEWRNNYYQGSVIGSFYVSAKKAGLSVGQIQQISGALQDKINFNRELRAGDSFQVLVAKKYIDGVYSFDSEVLATIIKTRSATYTAFLHEDGRYYDKNGKGLSKAYRRYPINGKHYVTSRFNPRRLHPVTKRISPHNGTDFRAKVGTRVYSVGDGVVTSAYYHPAAGNYIVIKHGRKYTSRFLHLSKILVRKGQRVEMGQLIGRSGNTGRSTGPHLHYEFHVYNKPVDPMKVNLPLSQEVSKKEKAAFNKRRDLFLREMGEIK
ncbi:peptidoglycan DD-metalloendopeptidase family protein [Psychromonas algicola]|uniref:peptidoglycan DD-metalloendopeptidase family protein n=1 Tax=Psychromonas algicola TaxID=2555642 RepID=UPI001068D00D|nr:peptidoglycan DD-metalloendopeptidase family protein [Psychromonas sp. RZ5]TEW50266.1 LysM peptidoglycan-binding domain-containing protein [Psychromonas sp. RZ5]